jgi:hypothetical protein
MAIETIGFLPTLYLVMGTYFLLLLSRGADRRPSLALDSDGERG